MSETLLLSEDEVRQLLSMDESIEIVESTFRAIGLGQVIMPPKLKLDFESNKSFSSFGSYLTALPAFVGGEFNLAGIKWGGAFSKNRNSNLPYIIATIILTNPETGTPLAFMGGSYITAIRTAAASAVSIKYLANPDSKTASVIGAGMQGRYQSLALSKVLKLEKLRIVAHKMDQAEKLCKELLDNFGVNSVPASDPSEVQDSDVIITATNSKVPILEKKWIKSGAFVSAVGSNQELTDDAIQSFDKIVVDNLQQNINSGNLKSPLSRGTISQSNIYSEIGQIVVGDKKSRESFSEKILFAHIGMGCLDVAVGTRVYRRALDLRKGTRFQLVP